MDSQFYAVLDNLLKNAVEQSIQNIGTASYINSQKVSVELFDYLAMQARTLLNLNSKDIQSTFELVGYKLFMAYHIPSFTWLDLLKKIHDELVYSIHHDVIDFDEEELEKRYQLLVNGLSLGYFKGMVEETLVLVDERIEAIDIELDINIHEIWYRQFLKSLTDDTVEQPPLHFEYSDSRYWIQSLDFKLLMKATTFSKKSAILVLTKQLYDIARELIFFIKQNNYKNAYHFLILLDQKSNRLSDLIKEVVVKFNLDKMYYFFLLFSETIQFKKHCGYFLTLHISHVIYQAHSRDIRRLLLAIYKITKSEAKQGDYDITGVINDDKALHILLNYRQKNDFNIVFELIKKGIKSLQQKEVVLFVPQLLVRAADTEAMSGMSADKLALLAMQMSNYHVDLPQYLLTPKECEELCENVEAKHILNHAVLSKIQQGEIELFFQPVICVDNDVYTLAYSEVLTRIIIQDEVVAAQQFIEAVQSQNLGSQLDQQVFERLATMTELISEKMSGVSVNLFPHSFTEKSTMKSVEHCLQAFQQAGLTLKLEITEYNLFEHYQTLESLIQKYSQTLQIAIDDFGSGYSSLAALIKLSRKGLLHTLKIDGSLTKNILDDNISLQVVSMAIKLAERLQAAVVVEYIESKETLDEIAHLTPKFYAQGYFFSKAVRLEQLSGDYQ